MNREAIVKREWQFDVLKCISCILVVLFHYPLPGVVGEIIIYAFRFPVPMFCMITGYFAYEKDNKWILSKAIYIGKLIFFTELAHGAIKLLLLCLGDENVGNLFPAFPNVMDAFFFVVQKLFCGSFFNGTLWYLYGAFWSYFLIIAFRKMKISDSLCIVVITVLLSINVLGRYYVQHNYNINEYVWLFRNALTMIFPLTLTGMMIRKYRLALKRRFDVKKSLVIVLVGNMMIVLEYIMNGQYMDFHYSTFVITVGLFLFAMTYNGIETPVLRLLSDVGRKWSMWIYILHPFASEVYQVFNAILRLFATLRG
jgi:hypothetical protein